MTNSTNTQNAKNILVSNDPDGDGYTEYVGTNYAGFPFRYLGTSMTISDNMYLLQDPVDYVPTNQDATLAWVPSDYIPDPRFPNNPLSTVGPRGLQLTSRRVDAQKIQRGYDGSVDSQGNLQSVYQTYTIPVYSSIDGGRTWQPVAAVALGSVPEFCTLFPKHPLCSSCGADDCQIDCADAPNGFCCLPHTLIDRLSKSLRG
jgi:hypothetical protein